MQTISWTSGTADFNLIDSPAPSLTFTDPANLVLTGPTPGDLNLDYILESTVAMRHDGSANETYNIEKSMAEYSPGWNSDFPTLY